MSAIVYDHEFALSVLLESGQLEYFVEVITDSEQVYRSVYERNLFVISLTKLCLHTNQLLNPAQVKTILTSIILMLIRHQRLEQTKQKREDAKLGKRLQAEEEEAPTKGKEKNNQTKEDDEDAIIEEFEEFEDTYKKLLPEMEVTQNQA